MAMASLKQPAQTLAVRRDRSKIAMGNNLTTETSFGRLRSNRTTEDKNEEKEEHFDARLHGEEKIRKRLEKRFVSSASWLSLQYSRASLPSSFPDCEQVLEFIRPNSCRAAIAAKETKLSDANDLQSGTTIPLWVFMFRASLVRRAKHALRGH